MSNLMESASHPTGSSRERNRRENESLSYEKAAHNGLGRRERRRIAAGIRLPDGSRGPARAAA